MKNKNLLYIASVIALLLLIISCPGCKGITSGLTAVGDALTHPSAREVYAREFKDNKEIYAAWQAAYDKSANDSLTISLPYGEKGTFIPYSNAAYSYTVQLQQGEVLMATVVKDSVNQRVFIDVFEKRGSGYTHTTSNKINDATLGFAIEATGTYKIILQPEMAASTSFFFSLSTKPQYGFPVAGKGNADIMSFWGVERDGGRRKHEGVDIFAKRGTPVVAAAKGTVGFTGERGIGGRQVWLHDGLLGNSLYYAHLDSIAVQTGAVVKAGDTLGFVGNTGNAQFTPPHLHFGIYKSGAVNPLPYIYRSNKIAQAGFAHTYTSNMLKAKGKANLRQGPDTKSKVVGTLTTNDTIIVLGQHNDWLHIQTTTGQAAFLHKSLAK